MQNRLRAALGSAGADADTMLGRNGWKPVGDGLYENASQPGAQITLNNDGSWALHQTSKTGRSSSLKNAGHDQSTLESFLTGGKPVVKRGPTSVDDLIELSQGLVDRADKKNTIIGNSATARRAEGAKAFGELGDMVDQAHQVAGAAKKGGFAGMAGHLWQTSSDYLLKGLTDKRREAISKLLYSTDPADRTQAVELIDRLRKGKAIPEAMYRPGFSSPAVGQMTGNKVGSNE